MPHWLGPGCVGGGPLRRKPAYAVNADAPHHDAAKRWLEEVLSGDEPIALPWSVVLGFLRVSTLSRIFPNALSVEEALSAVDGWLSLPVVRTLQPSSEHWRILRSLIVQAGTAGNLTTDAHLAALAIEHGSELCSTDNDFRRFRQLRWSNPLELSD